MSKYRQSPKLLGQFSCRRLQQHDLYIDNCPNRPVRCYSSRILADWIRLKNFRFGPFTCVAGANGIGSNLFDAISFISAIAGRAIAPVRNCLC